MANITLTVNGKTVTKDVTPNTLLSTFIRETLHLTGTHIGCDTSQCGACSIHLDGKAIKSCSILAIQADGCEITTIEGISDGDKLHPMQEAFRNNHGLQCGYCTPGMIMSGIKLVENNPNISESGIRKGLEGNICRCTGYNNIVKSIAEASVVMGGK
jgi:carbon-monoxide dehydrogenase small subunit